MKIIGLGHYSRTGKDSLANLLIGEIYEIDSSIIAAGQAFAYKLKLVCHDLYQNHGLRGPRFYNTPQGAELRTQKLPTIEMSPVDIWIAVGNAIRSVDLDTWIDCVLGDETSCDVLVIPDVRYPNEVDAIRERGGTLVKVVRTGYGPKDTVADRALLDFDGWDYVAGPTLEALKRDAKYLAACVVNGENPQQSEAMRRAILDHEKPPLVEAA